MLSLFVASTCAVEKIDLTNVPILNADFNKKRTELFIRLPGIQASHLYTITLNGVADQEGNPLMGDVMRYKGCKTALKIICISKEAKGLFCTPKLKGWQNIFTRLRGSVTAWNND